MAAIIKGDKVVIVGAGLAGSLLGIAMAKKGFDVHVYERRPDLRKENISAGRSINLALSSRGVKSLSRFGLENEIEALVIPMKGRMVHTLEGEKFLSPYSGRDNENILSISRGGLNKLLLDKLETYPNVKIYFNHNCTHCSYDPFYLSFRNVSENISIENAKVVLGTDGYNSAIRKSMLEKSNEIQFSYSQEYLDYGYKELSIPPSENGGFLIEKNALHIWPRGKFMIIALPNLDGSFTVTIFHPHKGHEGFENLTTEEEVTLFFKKYYPELIQLMPDYLNEFFANPTGNLCTVKCRPWQANGKSLLMGDAAHAVVPFYGQGMNASFEDVRIFDELLDEHKTWPSLFEAFQTLRIPNANAIADLAIDNFYEMRDRVDDADFLFKRKLEMQLEQTYPDYFSKYSMVTFQPDMGYEEAMIKGRKQDEYLLSLYTEKNNNLDLEEIYRGVKNV